MPPQDTLNRLTPWVCPRCRGELSRSGERLECRSCGCDYPTLGGIPDLRIDAPAWVDPEADRERARSLLALSDTSAAELAYQVFKRRQGWSERDARLRSVQAMELPSRMTREFDGWLHGVALADGAVLDLGCGSGGLLAAVARRGLTGIGIDVSLEWLVVARRLIIEHGGIPVLAAAMAEGLPFPNASLGAVTSLDVVEHVGDQARYLGEIDRVLAPGGVCALATPNRFSLAPEPHVGLWGVGWLPRAWQQPYVQWRSSKPYDYCVLLSAPELYRLFGRCTSLHAHIMPGIVPNEELDRFSTVRRSAAHAYNRLAATTTLRSALLPICPFFQVIATKPAA